MHSNTLDLRLWLVPRADDRAACLIVELYSDTFAQIDPCISRDQAASGSSPQTFSIDGHTDIIDIVSDDVDVRRAYPGFPHELSMDPRTSLAVQRPRTARREVGDTTSRRATTGVDAVLIDAV